ncbi:MAG: PHP domain-containing protein, partial [Clostridia bacterium]|nr:PHP domain-containing protein [Clostridia bacterium]
MSDLFLDVFGEYISEPKYREMLKDTTFSDLYIHKDDLKLTANLYFKEFKNIMCLKATANEIKVALRFKTVEFNFFLPPEALDYSCFPMLLKVLKVNVPQTNGFLDKSEYTYENDTLTIKFLSGGCDICKNAAADTFLENYIFEHFGKKITVNLEGENSNLEDFIRIQEEIDAVNNRVPEEAPKERRVIEGIPLYLETATSIYGNEIKKDPINMKDITVEEGEVVVWGDIFKLETRLVKEEKFRIIEFNVTDYTYSYMVKLFGQAEKFESLVSKLKEGMTVIVRGYLEFDTYKGDTIIDAKAISTVQKFETTDDAEEKRVELHLHTNMSAMDAMSSAKSLVKRAMSWGHKAIAITDHGCVQAFPEACNTAKGTDFKIIYGCECYLVDDYNSDGTTMDAEDIKKSKSYHCILLVKNTVGLKNLYKLISASNLEYFYKRPRMPKSLIEKHREGLIIGSACEAGELYSAFLERKSLEELIKIAEFYDYLEIQPNGNNSFMITKNDEEYDRVNSFEDLEQINREIIALGDKLGKKTVATGDVHFLNEGDAKFRAILQAGQG